MKLLLTNKAFTLIELLIAITVLCAIIIIALPALTNLLQNNRLRANSDLFVNALNYARNTALNGSMTVAVCPLGTPNSTTCGTNWNSGWIVVSQPATGTPTLLQSKQSDPQDPTLTGTVSSINFDRHGLATPGNFTFCDRRGNTSAQSVMVLSTGFIQSGTTPGQAVWNNGALSCP